MPSASRSSGFSREWVVVAGWVIRLLESPRLFEMSTSRSASRKRKQAALSPTMSKATTVPPGELILRMARQARVDHAGHLRVGFEEMGDRLGGMALPLDPQFQGFEALQQEPGVEGAQRWAGVAVEQPEIVLDVFLAGEDRAAEGAALAVDVLGRGIDDDVGAERQWLLQQRGREHVVDDENAAGAMGQPRHLGDVDDLHRRVRWALAKGQRCARRQRGLPGRQIATVDLHGFDAIARQQVGNDVMTRTE